MRALFVAGVLCLSVAGCQSASPSGGSFGDHCNSVCTRLTPACFGLSTSTCSEVCTLQAISHDRCPAQVEAVFTCLDGVSDLMGCQDGCHSQYDALLACLTPDSGAADAP